MASSSSTEQDNPRSIDQDVLARIQHLDLSDKITGMGRSAVAYGGFCEVFRGRLLLDEREYLDVAIKRLRFHVNETNVKKAGPLVLLP